MSSPKKSFNEMFDHIRSYFETQKQILKLQVVEKVSTSSASLTSTVIIFVFYLLTFLFFSIALALFAGDLLGKWYLGFGAVALLYLIIALILSAGKEKILKTPIANSMIKSLLKNEQD
jgi:hypothetical protein